MTDHESYMRQALALAEEAAAAGEVPVGCVIVREGQVIGRGRNRREEKQAVSSHAEMEAMAEANAALGSWRLEDCSLYVTLEPCPMCAGAILHARIPRIVCGAMDPVAGAMGSVWALHRHPVENQHTRLETGCLEEACGELLREFFRSRREE